MNSFFPYALKALTCTAEGYSYYDQTLQCSGAVHTYSYLFTVCYAIGFAWFFVAPACESCRLERPKLAGQPAAKASPAELEDYLSQFFQQLPPFAGCFLVLNPSFGPRASGVLLSLVLLEAAFFCGLHCYRNRRRRGGRISAPFVSPAEQMVYAFGLLVLVITYSTGVHCARNADAKGDCPSVEGAGSALIGLHAAFFAVFSAVSLRWVSCCGAWSEHANDSCKGFSNVQGVLK